MSKSRKIALSLLVVFILCTASMCNPCPDGYDYSTPNNPNYKNGLCKNPTTGDVQAATDWIEEGHKDTVIPGTEGGDPNAQKAQDWVKNYGSNPVDNVNKGLDTASNPDTRTAVCDGLSEATKQGLLDSGITCK